MLTKKKLKRFIKMRNDSPFNNNLQFLSDAKACGFDAEVELGDATKVEEGVYQWETPFGILVERYGKLELVEE